MFCLFFPKQFQAVVHNVVTEEADQTSDCCLLIDALAKSNTAKHAHMKVSTCEPNIYCQMPNMIFTDITANENVVKEIVMT